MAIWKSVFGGVMTQNERSAHWHRVLTVFGLLSLGFWALVLLVELVLFLLKVGGVL